MAFDVLSFAIGRQTAKGNGSVAGVHFVTFMNEDGSTELYKRPVADGDDCADPVKRGLIPEPTKESTAQYNYTHVGWSEAPDGALDSNILKAVKADKTVYANFAAVVRYYTVTYYDSDGTTVLKTESLAYGTMPSYAPKKEGYVLDRWTPEVSTVTGNTSYIANWTKKLTFADALWSDIIRVSEAGQAADMFSLGDTKTISAKWNDGTSFELELQIIGFDHDDLADGSGKAKMTIATKNALSLYNLKGAGLIDANNGWANSTIRSALNDVVLGNLPTDMTQYIKEVTKISKTAYKTYTATETIDKLFIPSSREYTGSNGGASSVEEGSQYEYYKTADNRKKYGQNVDGTNESAFRNHFTRTTASTSGWFNYIRETGVLVTNSTENVYASFAFCI